MNNQKQIVLRWMYLVFTGACLAIFCAGTARSVPVDFYLPEIQKTKPQTREEALLTDALAYIHEGRYEDAIKKTEAVFSTNPDSAQAYEIWGVSLAKKGDLQSGLEKLEKAVEINPRQHTAYTKIGDVYMAQNKIQKARKAFEKAIDINPSDRRAHQRLGLIYEDEKEFGLARKHYEQGIKGTPKDYIGIKVNLGRIYNRFKRFDETISLLEPVVTKDTQNAEAHIVLGTACLEEKRTGDAIDHFLAARQVAPEEKKAALPLGIAYRINGDLEKSLHQLEKVTKENPKWATGFFQKGETLNAMKRYNEALDSYKKAEKFSSKPHHIRRRIAETNLSLNNTEEATAVFEKIIEDGEADPGVYEMLGDVYQNTRQLDKAEKTLQALQNEFPDSAFPYYRLGLFYGFTRQYDKAISQLEKALELAPGDATSLKALAVVHQRKGERQKAIETIEKLISEHPENLSEKTYLATLYHDAGKHKQAKRLYREILEKETGSVIALNNLADLLLDEGKLDEAQKLAEKGIRAAPDNGMVLDTMGWILFKQENYQRSLQYLEKAVQLSPDSAVINYHLAAAYHKTGNNTYAQEKLRTALDFSGDFKGADEARALLTKLSD